MRTRLALATFVLALTSGGVSLPAQEMPQPQIANWPAPAFWEPPPGTSRGLGTESALAVSSSSPMPFVAVTPCRVVDTRLSGGAYAAGETRTYLMTGGSLPCVTGFPNSIAAVSLNITITQTAGTGFVTGFPAGASLPVVASLTWIGANQTLSNAAVVPTGTGSINIYASQATHVILDINGYYGATLTSISSNVFLGPFAGNATMSGQINTAIGFGPLQSNTTGNFNTAVGNGALEGNTTGNDNTASGAGALQANQTGSDNTANGYVALFNNKGSNNTASGSWALQFNTTGSENTGSGYFALRNNTTGSTNTAVGSQALVNLGSGIGNIAIGAGAGSNYTSGNDNICIHSDGVNGESNTIRIGRFFHSAAFIFGISGATVTGAPVLVSSSGQLGVASSSRSVKDDIREIAGESDGLMRLRPVAFKYKPEIDPTGLTQYGLIAEEVAEVYPDLVVLDRNGKPQTVRYHLLVPMLLNELQKQEKRIARLDSEKDQKVAEQQGEIERLKADFAALRALVNQH